MRKNLPFDETVTIHGSLRVLLQKRVKIKGIIWLVGVIEANSKKTIYKRAESEKENNNEFFS